MTMPIDFDNIGERRQPPLTARRGGRGSFAPSSSRTVESSGSSTMLKSEYKITSKELNPYLRMKAGMDAGRFKKIGPTMPPKGALEDAAKGGSASRSQSGNEAVNAMMREERTSSGDLDKGMMKQIARSGGMDDEDGLEQVADDMESRQSRADDGRGKKFKKIKTIDDKYGRTSIEGKCIFVLSRPEVECV